MREGAAASGHGALTVLALDQRTAITTPTRLQGDAAGQGGAAGRSSRSWPARPSIGAATLA